MMANISIGIEIECIVNTNMNKITTGEYHHGRVVEGLEGWVAEEDSSLHDDGEFSEYGKCVEFVSPVFKSKDKFFQGLEQFKDKLSHHGQYELDHVLVFNESCGSHVHFSIKGFCFSKKVIFEIYPKVRTEFMEKLMQSTIADKESILNHYHRDYARKLNKSLWSMMARTAEFNLFSEQEAKGLEWRGLNLLNITTWEDFFSFWHLVYECLEYLYSLAQKYQEVDNIYLLEEREAEKTSAQDQDLITYKAKKRKKTYSIIKVPLTIKKEAVL
jgi:hypothetical protein